MKSEVRLQPKRRVWGIARFTAGLLAMCALAAAADVDAKIASLETAVKSAQMRRRQRLDADQLARWC